MATYPNNLVDQYGRPIIGALVTALQNNIAVATATTDSSGAFTLTTPGGFYTIQYRVNGSLVREDYNVQIGTFAQATAQPINEAPNSNFQLIPDLGLVRKMVIGAGGLPTGAQRAAYTATQITTGTNTPAIKFSTSHDFRVNELVLAPVTTAATSAGLNLCPLRVLSVTTTTVANDTITVEIPRGKTAVAATDANGAWTSMTVGDATGATGDLMSGDDTGQWNKSASLKVWIEDHPILLGLFPGATRVWLVQKGSAAEELIFFAVTPNDRPGLFGRTRGFGFAVANLSGGSSTTIFYNNGIPARGALVNGTGRVFISQSGVVAGTGFYGEGISFGGASGGNVGDWYAVAEFTRLSGIAPVDGQGRPGITRIRPQGSVTAATMNGASITFPTATDANGQYSYHVDLYQESSGRFGPNVKAIGWNLEGVNAITARIIATKERAGIPTTYGHVVTSNVSGAYSANYCVLNLSNSGFHLYSVTSGDAWTFVSMDCNQVIA